MLRLDSAVIGVDQGESAQFDHCENGGIMWTGTGDREVRRRIAFSGKFRRPPKVQAYLTMWDIDNEMCGRAEVTVQNVERDGFESVFKTWGDTRIARARVGWMAIGELSHDDNWSV